MGRKKINKIEKFINDNKLDFSGSGSDLNGNCVILAGYACYLELNETDFFELFYTTLTPSYNVEVENELKRLLKYAYNKNYDQYWYTSEAKGTYIF
jgi:hypothetical protein